MRDSFVRNPASSLRPARLRNGDLLNRYVRTRSTAFMNSMPPVVAGGPLPRIALGGVVTRRPT